MYAHRVAENIGKRRLAETGRTRKQHMVQRLPAFLGRLHGQLKAVADLLLAHEIGKPARTQPIVKGHVSLVQFIAWTLRFHH